MSGMEPSALAMLIGGGASAAGAGLGAAFGPNSDTEPFTPGGEESNTYAENLLSTLLGNTDTAFDAVKGRANADFSLPSAFVGDLPTFTGGSLPMPIGALSRDPAFRNRSLLSSPGSLGGDGSVPPYTGPINIPTPGEEDDPANGGYGDPNNAPDNEMDPGWQRLGQATDNGFIPGLGANETSVTGVNPRHFQGGGPQSQQSLAGNVSSLMGGEGGSLGGQFGGSGSLTDMVSSRLSGGGGFNPLGGGGFSSNDLNQAQSGIDLLTASAIQPPQPRRS